MGKILGLAFLGVCIYVVLIRNDGALFVQFVDAVAPLLADQMLDNAGQ